MLHVIPLLAVVCYCLSATRFFRTLSASDAAASDATVSDGRGYLVFGFSFQAIFLILDLLGYFSEYHQQTTGVLPISFPLALSVVSWLVVGVYLFAHNWRGIERLGVFIAPVGAIFMIFSGLIFHLPAPAARALNLSPVLGVHVICWLISILFLGFGFVVSIAVILKEALLKRRKFTQLQHNLPSLISLDRLHSFFLYVGLGSMLLGVLTGIAFAWEVGINTLLWDPRFIWSLLTATIYLVLFFARQQHGLRGSRAAWLSIAGFTTLIISFVGVSAMGGGLHV